MSKQILMFMMVCFCICIFSTMRVSAMDYSEINKAMNNYTDISMDFEELVNDITIGNGESISDNLFEQLKKSIVNEVGRNKKAITQVFLLAVISALFTNFAKAFYNPQISEMGYLVLSILLFTIMIAVFSMAVSIVSVTLNTITGFMKILIPVYGVALFAVTGSLTGKAFYSLLVIVITIVNNIFKNVMINVCWIYALLSMSDCIANEERMSKLAEFIKVLITWAIRAFLVTILGINTIQGMILPIADKTKTGLLVKALRMIPGIGNGASVLSSTVIGASTIIKNGIGAAAIVVLCAIAIIPVIKLILLILSYKLIAAVVQPIADKRVVKCINNVTEGMNILLNILISSMALFLVMLAIMCMTTNGSVT